jgi:hypothetical protein
MISVPGPSRAHFLGKWEVGQGNGENFYITLNDDGTAQRTMNDLEHERGTWVYAHGEAQVTWADGWQDCIRKVGSWYKKYAYHEGKTFTDEPDNVTNAPQRLAESQRRGLRNAARPPLTAAARTQPLHSASPTNTMPLTSIGVMNLFPLPN